LQDTSQAMNRQSSGTLRRVLPLLALIAALFGTWLTPPPAALAGIGAWNADRPAADAADCSDRTAVKPTPLHAQSPSQLKASIKQRLASSSEPAPDPLVATATIAVERTIGAPRRVDSHAEILLPNPAARVAQPRAPPSSRI
jgi:hypothetical protein